MRKLYALAESACMFMDLCRLRSQSKMHLSIYYFISMYFCMFSRNISTYCITYVIAYSFSSCFVTSVVRFTTFGEKQYFSFFCWPNKPEHVNPE